MLRFVFDEKVKLSYSRADIRLAFQEIELQSITLPAAASAYLLGCIRPGDRLAGWSPAASSHASPPGLDEARGMKSYLLEGSPSKEAVMHVELAAQSFARQPFGKRRLAGMSGSSAADLSKKVKELQDQEEEKRLKEFAKRIADERNDATLEQEETYLALMHLVRDRSHNDGADAYRNKVRMKRCLLALGSWKKPLAVNPFVVVIVAQLCDLLESETKIFHVFQKIYIKLRLEEYFESSNVEGFPRALHDDAVKIAEFIDHNFPIVPWVFRVYGRPGAFKRYICDLLRSLTLVAFSSDHYFDMNLKLLHYIVCGPAETFNETGYAARKRLREVILCMFMNQLSIWHDINSVEDYTVWHRQLYGDLGGCDFSEHDMETLLSDHLFESMEQLALVEVSMPVGRACMSSVAGSLVGLNAGYMLADACYGIGAWHSCLTIAYSSWMLGFTFSALAEWQVLRTASEYPDEAKNGSDQESPLGHVLANDTDLERIGDAAASSLNLGFDSNRQVSG